MMKYEDSVDEIENIPFPAITFNNELQFIRPFHKIYYELLRVELTVDDIIYITSGDKYFVRSFKRTSFSRPLFQIFC
jgi:hypothetical protein